MLEIDEFPSPLTQVKVLAFAGEVQAPRFANAVQWHGRRCETSAREQGLRNDQLERPGIFAVLGLTEDRSVMGLRKECGVWHISRAPLPSALVPLLWLTPLSYDKAQPVWIHLLPDYLAIFKDGKEVPVWDSRRQAVDGVAMASRGSNSPVPGI